MRCRTLLTGARRSRVKGSYFTVQGSGFRVQGSGCVDACRDLISLFRALSRSVSLAFSLSSGAAV